MISALFLCFLLGAVLVVVFVVRPRHLFGNRDLGNGDAPPPHNAFGNAGGEIERRKPGLENGKKTLEERRKDDDVGGES